MDFRLPKNTLKPIAYIDMDNVLVDFPSGVAKLSDEYRVKYTDRYDECPGIFSLMEPMPGAVEATIKLSEAFDLFILSTAPWLNSTAWSDKLLWVQKHYGNGEESIFYKRVILSHHKNLLNGAYLIDDRKKNGAADFKGELILFGSERFPNWNVVADYLYARLLFP